MIEARNITFDAAGTILNGSATDFWRSLPEAVAVQLAKAAPKVAGPWTGSVPGYRVRGAVGDDSECAAVIEPCVICHGTDEDEELFGWKTEEYEGAEFTCDQAEVQADMALRAAGWVLESEAAE